MVTKPTTLPKYKLCSSSLRRTSLDKQLEEAVRTVRTHKTTASVDVTPCAGNVTDENSCVFNEISGTATFVPIVENRIQSFSNLSNNDALPKIFQAQNKQILGSVV
jgi:predicted Abi (CAAX) family protease